MVIYNGLEKLLTERGLSKTNLTKDPGISSRTIAKIGKGEKLSRLTLQKIADYFSCNPEDLYKEIADNPILQALREEKEARISGGLYHELQVRMTYNSNRIEGSMLTEEQTRLIFETHTIDVSDGIPIDDILDTVHHFRAIDYIIDIAEQDLSEAIIKELHKILKHDTKDSQLSWFAVGEYRKRPNFVGGRETTNPNAVPVKIKELLRSYHRKPTVTLEDIIAFHVVFERIHPFQDGNGRVGRLIALKECLRHNIVPFLIEDIKKAYYYRGLAEWDNTPEFLIGTCLDGQDTFRRLLAMFKIDVE